MAGGVCGRQKMAHLIDASESLVVNMVKDAAVGWVVDGEGYVVCV